MSMSEKIKQTLEVLNRLRERAPSSPAQLATERRQSTKALALELGITQNTIFQALTRGLQAQRGEDFHVADFEAVVWDWLNGKPEALQARCAQAATGDDDQAAIADFFGDRPWAPVHADAPTSRAAPPPRRSGKDIVEHVFLSLEAEGLDFSRTQVADLYLSMRTKPFVLLAGVSGTGKSIVARRFAQACGFPAAMVAVRPDWSDPSELLGYRDLEGAYVPGRLIPHLVAAAEAPEQPYIVILDEMNLARVEHYFADLLSLMETRSLKESGVETDALALAIDAHTPLRCDPSLQASLKAQLSAGGLRLPPNLIIVGTVNMDESTHPFSKKVLDRAMTLEFVTVNLARVPELRRPPPPMPVHSADLDAPYLSLAQVYVGQAERFKPAIDLLVELNKVLSSASMQVGYRTRDELCVFLHHNREQQLLDETTALDLAVYHKVLPRLQGGEELRGVLQGLRPVLSTAGLIRCAAKIDELLRRLEAAGFAAFWA